MPTISTSLKFSTAARKVVDADDLDVAEVLDCRAEDHAADTAEAVDANLDCHFLFSFVWLVVTVESGAVSPKHAEP